MRLQPLMLQGFVSKGTTKSFSFSFSFRVTIQVEKLTGTPEKAALIDSIRFMLCLRTVEK